MSYPEFFLLVSLKTKDWPFRLQYTMNRIKIALQPPKLRACCHTLATLHRVRKLPCFARDLRGVAKGKRGKKGFIAALVSKLSNILFIYCKKVSCDYSCLLAHICNSSSCSKALLICSESEIVYQHGLQIWQYLLYLL